MKNYYKAGQVVMAHTFNPSTQEAEQVGLCEFEASLIYRVSFWKVRTTQRNPVSTKQNTIQNKTKELL
jgi:hypothetical protein